jgi:hypothetical protein
VSVTPLTKDDQLRDARREPHGRGCPCKPCQGRRNRRKGQVKQRVARKALGVPDAKYASQLGHEENWRGAVRCEVKSGQQIKALVTRFLQAELQSEMSRAKGDTRPFVFCGMPDGWGADGVFACRITDLPRVIADLAEVFEQF